MSKVIVDNQHIANLKKIPIQKYIIVVFLQKYLYISAYTNKIQKYINVVFLQNICIYIPIPIKFRFN